MYKLLSRSFSLLYIHIHVNIYIYIYVQGLRVLDALRRWFSFPIRYIYMYIYIRFLVFFVRVSYRLILSFSMYIYVYVYIYRDIGLREDEEMAIAHIFAAYVLHLVSECPGGVKGIV